MPTVVQRCLDIGFADYVTKPFTSERLFGAIDAALAGPEQHRVGDGQRGGMTG
jgi:DNA-binding response OmpR family regulator